MAEYIVLRNLAVDSKRAPGQAESKNWDWSAGPFEAATKSMRELEAVQADGNRPKPEVSVQSLDFKEVKEFAGEPGVAAIAPLMATYLIRPLSDVEPAAAGDAWGIAAVGADRSNWTGEGVTVAILDTGIDRQHPAFAGVDIVEKDFTGSGDGDRQGHGTHCAGTVFGRDVDGKRIGIARGVNRALIGKVLGDQGGGNSNMIFEGIQWAIQQGAQVISMSLGFDFPGAVDRMVQQGWPVPLATSNALEAYRANLRMFDALMQMVRASENFGGSAVIVAASGNESRVDQDPKFRIAASLPAAAEGVISVGALRPDGSGFGMAPFSNIFPQVSAPGVGILSAKVGGGLRSLSGTSMACPHVAGVAALWWHSIKAAGQIKPKATNIIDRLRATARVNVFGSGIGADDRGVGIVTAP